jgi:hypothetical protein
MDQYPQQTPPNFPPAGFPPTSAVNPQGQPVYPSQPEYPPTPSGYLQQPGYPPTPSGYLQQPGYPPPQPAFPPGAYPPPDLGQPGYVPPQPPAKNKTTLWVVIGVVALLVVGGIIGGLVLFQSAQNSPTGTLQKFCDGYKNLDAQAVYDTFSSNFKGKASSSENSLQEAFGLLKAFGGKIDNCTFSNVQQNGSTATATLTITATVLGTTRTTSEPVTLVQENGQWKIDNIQSSSSTP